MVLESMARYAGLLLAPGESFDQGFFCTLGENRAFYAALVHYGPLLGVQYYP